jgi:hypothetical protein
MSDIVKDEVRRALHGVRKKLKWEVVVTRQGSHFDPCGYSIKSSAVKRRHELFLPPNGEGVPYDKVSELHEYVHALLTETVHPAFGNTVIGTLDDLSSVQFVKGLINETIDWFVNAWICSHHPAAYYKRLARNADLLNPENIEKVRSCDPQPLWGCATLAEMAAELKTFSHWDQIIFDPMVCSMTHEFLITDVLHPTVDVAADLINRLIPEEMGLVVVPETKPNGEPYWLVCREADLMAISAGNVSASKP